MGPQPGMAGTLKPPTALCSVPLFWVHGCAQEGTDVMFGMPSLPTSLWVSEQTQPGVWVPCLGAVSGCRGVLPEGEPCAPHQALRESHIGSAHGAVNFKPPRETSWFRSHIYFLVREQSEYLLIAFADAVLRFVFSR